MIRVIKNILFLKISLFCFNIYSQTQGVVLDTKKNPIEGVQVLISDLNLITKTDKNGEFILDQNIPFHSGFKFRKMRNWVTKDKYYFALNNFFKDFEEKTNLKVVIAAHPRSRYDLHPECLYGRKYFHYN